MISVSLIWFEKAEREEAEAMGEMNRWKVTYTKHLKQKRKVYHDGFLDIHRSSNKVSISFTL